MMKEMDKQYLILLLVEIILCIQFGSHPDFTEMDQQICSATCPHLWKFISMTLLDITRLNLPFHFRNERNLFIRENGSGLG